MMKLSELFTQVLPQKPQPETTLTTTAQTSTKCGEWNTGRGTRKELKETAKKMRKKIKREKAIWERYAKARKA